MAQVIRLPKDQFTDLLGMINGLALSRQIPIPGSSVPVRGEAKNKGATPPSPSKTPKASQKPAGKSDKGSAAQKKELIPVPGSPTSSGKDKATRGGQKRKRVEVVHSDKAEGQWRSRLGQLTSIATRWTTTSPKIRNSLCGGDGGRLIGLIALHMQDFKSSWGDVPALPDAIAQQVNPLLGRKRTEEPLLEASQWLALSIADSLARRANTRGVGGGGTKEDMETEGV